MVFCGLPLVCILISCCAKFEISSTVTWFASLTASSVLGSFGVFLGVSRGVACRMGVTTEVSRFEELMMRGVPVLDSSVNVSTVPVGAGVVTMSTDSSLSLLFRLPQLEIFFRIPPVEVLTVSGERLLLLNKKGANNENNRKNFQCVFIENCHQHPKDRSHKINLTIIG